MIHLLSTNALAGGGYVAKKQSITICERTIEPVTRRLLAPATSATSGALKTVACANIF